MKVELTDVSQVKKKLQIEVDQDSVAAEMDKVVRSFRKQARIPGFRQGKTPAGVVKKRFAKEIRDEVRDHLLSHSYHDALEASRRRPDAAVRPRERRDHLVMLSTRRPARAELRSRVANSPIRR